MIAPTKTRQAFNEAEKELEQSVKKYNEARAMLQRETGEFIATDKNIPLQFKTAATNTPAAVQTDC